MMNRSSNRSPTRVTADECLLVLCGPTVALLVTPIMLVLPVPSPVIGRVWAAALIWTVLGVARGDWSRFGPTCDGDDERAREDHADFSTRTGRYAYLRILADHESLMRDGDRFLE